MKHLYSGRFRAPLLALGAGVLFVIGAATVPLTPPPADVRLDNPTELPRDVFDLAYFDRYRQNGRLDLPAAQQALEQLSDEGPEGLVRAQRLFDEFAWRAFIALNCPTKADGQPDPSRVFDNGDVRRVWDYWKQTSDVFLPNGARPAPWGSSSQPAADSYKAGWRQGPSANQGTQAFSGPLVDQNGRWLHYMALINHEDFDYVVNNELYNLEGQAVYQRNNQVSFPQNDDTHYGAIELKLAWKILTPAEIKSGRFLVQRLKVVPYRPATSPAALVPAKATDNLVPQGHLTGKSAGNATATQVAANATGASAKAGKALVSVATPGYALSNNGATEETVGLVGMHIAMRTRSSPQWIWATFEQIDNTQLDPHSASDQHPLPKRPSLSNPDDPYALVRANILPAHNAGDDWDETPGPNVLLPVQVLRLVPPPTSTATLNAVMQKLLGQQSSVLRYYELIGTQWPTHPKAPAVPGGQGTAPESITRKMPGEVVPVYLINSTMETYFQKGYQTAGPLEQDDRVGALDIDSTPVFGTESCTGCHYSAGACISFRKKANGQFLRDGQGRKMPIFGQNSNAGLTGSANYSWMLQIEAQSKEKPVL